MDRLIPGPPPTFTASQETARWVCDRCGALTETPDAHAAWHEHLTASLVSVMAVLQNLTGLTEDDGNRVIMPFLG